MGGQEDFAEFDEQMDNRQQFAEDPDSAEEDYDYGGIDLLSDVKEAERYATHAAPARRSTGAVEEEKIEGIDINDYNTAALDDLLEGPKPQRSSATVVEQKSDLLQTADPFAEPNQFSDTPKPEVEMDPFAEPPKAEAPAVNDGGQIGLDDLMGGLSLEAPKENVPTNPDPSVAANPATGDLDKLKDLYNTPAPAANPMGMGAPVQPAAFNTGMPMGGAPMGGAPMGGAPGFGAPSMGMGAAPMGGQPMGVGFGGPAPMAGGFGGAPMAGGFNTGAPGMAPAPGFGAPMGAGAPMAGAPMGGAPMGGAPAPGAASTQFSTGQPSGGSSAGGQNPFDMFN